MWYGEDAAMRSTTVCAVVDSHHTMCYFRVGLGFADTTINICQRNYELEVTQ